MAAEKKRYELNNKTLEELVRLVSRETGLTITYEAKVKLTQRFEIYNLQPMDEQELYERFLSILQLYDYAAIKNGSLVKIVRARAARSQPNPVYSQ